MKYSERMFSCYWKLKDESFSFDKLTVKLLSSDEPEWEDHLDQKTKSNNPVCWRSEQTDLFGIWARQRAAAVYSLEWLVM